MEKGIVNKLLSMPRGFSVIEVLVAIALFAFMVIGLSSAYILFSRSSLEATDRKVAIFLAEEGMEVVKNIANENFTNLVDGVFGLATSSNQWNFLGSSDTNGIFVRTIEISTINADTKKVESRVSWQNNRQVLSYVSLFSYFTNWSKISSSAYCLDVNVLNACLDNTNNYKNINNVTLTNSCDFDITIESAVLNWNNTNQIISLGINNLGRWNSVCDWSCSPSSTQLSGTVLDFGNNDLVLAASTTVNIEDLFWDSNMSSSTLSFLFNFDDSTLASSSIFSPISCNIFIPDTTPPSAIVDLSSSNPSQSTIDLSWTAPGDDNNIGLATTYDLRYSTNLITEENWSSAVQISDEPIPFEAGTSQNMTVTGLNPVTTYYFAIKTSDEVPNISSISNVISATTSEIPDVIAPAAISNLSISNPTLSSFNLLWTAPGDDIDVGTAAGYDIRHFANLITESNWITTNQISGEPNPLTAGTSQNMLVSGLSPATTYYFAIKTFDEVPNTSAISNIASGTTVASWLTPLLDGSSDLTGTHDGTKVQIVGDYAYVVRVDGTPDFQIINISDTANPVVLGSLSLAGTPKNIYVLGDYAYVASTDNTRELQIINISNPDTPNLVGSYNAVGNADANGIFVRGTVAYLVRASSGDPEFFTINVNVPDSPTLLDSLELGGTAYETVVSGNHAFVASGVNNQEVQVINVLDPAVITLVETLDLATNNDAITVSLVGPTLLVGQSSNLRVVNIFDPLSISQIGSITLGSTITDIALDYGQNSNYAFVSILSNTGPEFRVINISNLNSPSAHGTGYNYTGGLNGVAYSQLLDRAVAVGTGVEFIIIKPQ